VEGSEAEIDAAFMKAYGILRYRIEQFLALPLEALKNNREQLKSELDRISTLLP
jgi:arsenate reductase (thioredoxin)